MHIGQMDSPFHDRFGRALIARPSIEVKSESFQESRSAPFDRALAEFFLPAFSDRGDILFDPFKGSGTTISTAALQNSARPTT